MNKDKMFDLRFAVAAGRGRFPMDMLRYDRCSPFRGEDAALVDRESGDGDGINSRAIVVVRYAGQPGDWTDARWSSFCWGLRVMSDQHQAESWARELNESFQIGKKKEVTRG